MTRPILAAAVLLVALAVAVAALSYVAPFALSAPATPSGPVYSVAQVTTGLRQHPRTWAGRTVLVRGVFWGLRVSGGAAMWQGELLLDHPPLGPFTPNSETFTGPLRFNVSGMMPSLIARGALPMDTPLNRVRGIVRAAAVLLLGRSYRAAATWSTRPDVYRVQLFAPVRCPATVATPCFTAVVR